MAKVFEDYFSELQADMVSIALEYVDKRADYIYIYCSDENNFQAFDVFYQISGQVIKKSQLNTINTNYDVSINRQKVMINIGMEDLRSINKLFYDHNREMPTEIKLIYDVKNNKLNCEYSYDLKFSNSETLTASHIFDQWFNEVAQQV